VSQLHVAPGGGTARESCNDCGNAAGLLWPARSAEMGRSWQLLAGSVRLAAHHA